ncbi:MAG: DNA alkylation repair protein [Anaerolineae bacterium]|nr:DNA alkylation repair protein [Anaerolineae bacterium]
MVRKEAAAIAAGHLQSYEPQAADAVANALQETWVRAAPPQEKQAARDWGTATLDYPAVGTPVPVLRAIGQEVGKRARRRVDDYLPLARLLWDQYGREGRLVAAVALGPMELAEPHKVVPVLYELAQSCAFWEDCDQLAMKALEPVLRRDPDTWLEPLGDWVRDPNKWVRRAALTAIGRLPMERAEYTERCVELLAPALGDPDRDVKRALSFALRVSARGQVEPVKQFIRDHRDATDADRLWVLCDVARSMTTSLLPQFQDLLPIYEGWLERAEPRAQRSVEGAIRVLERA